MAGSIDLSQYPLDGPVPVLPETNGSKSRQKLLFDLARARKPDDPRFVSAHRRCARGHCQIVGTPVQIADKTEEWFTTGAADTFNIMPPHQPAVYTILSSMFLPSFAVTVPQYPARAQIAAD